MKKSIGQIIRDARESQDMTREQLAKKLKITPGYLGHIERDDAVHVSDRIYAAVKKMFGSKVSGFTSMEVWKHNVKARTVYKKYRSNKAA